MPAFFLFCLRLKAYSLKLQKENCGRMKIRRPQLAGSVENNLFYEVHPAGPIQSLGGQHGGHLVEGTEIYNLLN
jgi:hypothetical protein